MIKPCWLSSAPKVGHFFYRSNMLLKKMHDPLEFTRFIYFILYVSRRRGKA